VEGVTDGENEGDDCDEVIYVGWGEPKGEWTQWGWRNEEGSWFHTWGDAYLKERLVICNDEDTDGPAKVTTDEELATIVVISSVISQRCIVVRHIRRSTLES